MIVATMCHDMRNTPQSSMCMRTRYFMKDHFIFSVELFA